MFRAILLMFILASFEAHAYCKKCEDLRRFHEEHPDDNPRYYEDYLKEQQQKKPDQAPANIQNSNTQKPSR